MTVKRKDHDIEADADGDDGEAPEPGLEEDVKSVRVITKAAMAKKVLKKNIRANQLIKFDEDGQGVDADIQESGTKQSKEGKDYDADNVDGGGIDIAKAKEVLKAEDKFDRQVEKQKVRQRKLEERRKLKEAKQKRKKVITISKSFAQYFTGVCI